MEMGLGNSLVLPRGCAEVSGVPILATHAKLLLHMDSDFTDSSVNQRVYQCRLASNFYNSSGPLDLNVSAARERQSLMKMAQSIGGRTGLSIGFRTVKEEPDRKRPNIRQLKEIQLIEYSVVTFPMNPQAGVVNVKAKEQLIGQFLQNAVGLDERQTQLAISNLKSLLNKNNEPEPAHSNSLKLGADIPNWEPLRLSLCRLLSSVKGSY